MTFPGASATIYKNDAGEVEGWSYENDYDGFDQDDHYDALGDGDAMVCTEHKCFANECPKYHTDSLTHEDEFCCGPHGCCSFCCGTDEDDIRGAWHGPDCKIGDQR